MTAAGKAMNMPTEDQKQKLSGAIDRIRKAQAVLRTSYGDKVQAEYDKLDGLLTKIIEAKELEDDDAFKTAAGVLAQQSTVLQTDAAHVKAIVADVDAAATIAGYLVEAAQFLAKF
jgi:hypothetical protein